MKTIKNKTPQVQQASNNAKHITSLYMWSLWKIINILWLEKISLVIIRLLKFALQLNWYIDVENNVFDIALYGICECDIESHRKIE